MFKDDSSRTRAILLSMRRLQWWPGAKSDPYCIVNVGDAAAATAVVNQSLEPQWGETFFLFCR